MILFKGRKQNIFEVKYKKHKFLFDVIHLTSVVSEVRTF